MAIKTKRINGMTITYNDDQATRDAVFEKVLSWFIEMKSFSDAPNLLTDLGDDIFKFDIEDEEDI